MPLANRATQALPVIPGMNGVTCHFATWFWAAQEAQAQGLTAVKLPAVTIGNIAAMNPSAQAAMLTLPVSGQWDFSIVPTAPIAGSVLLWRNGATHSAIVTGPDRISGYNQVGWFPALQALGPHAQLGHTSPPPRSRAAGLPLADVIAEAVIVARAGQLNL